MSTNHHGQRCGCPDCLYRMAYHATPPVDMTSSAYDRPDDRTSSTSRRVPGRFEDEDEDDEYDDADRSDESLHHYRNWVCSVCERLHDMSVEECPCRKARARPVKREEARKTKTGASEALSLNLTVQRGTRVVIDTTGQDEDRKAAKTKKVETEDESDECDESDDGSEIDELVIVENDKDWEDRQQNDKTAGKGEFLLVDFQDMVTME